MSKLSQQDKLIALGYLYQGKSPRDVEEALPNVSYAQALRLKKELQQAIDTNTLQELFDLEEAALENLLDQVKLNLETSAAVLTGDVEVLEDAIGEVKHRIDSSKLLEAELANASRQVAIKISEMALITRSPDTLLLLADALSKMQTAFFKNTSVQIAQINNGGHSFEEFLQK